MEDLTCAIRKATSKRSTSAKSAPPQSTSNVKQESIKEQSKSKNVPVTTEPTATGYDVFRQTEYSRMKAENPSMKHKNLIGLPTEWWKVMPEENRKAYEPRKKQSSSKMDASQNDKPSGATEKQGTAVKRRNRETIDLEDEDEDEDDEEEDDEAVFRPRVKRSKREDPDAAENDSDGSD
ncbi:hypothetical protein QFC20_007268 [Naganishia adeliensis]|uniref:Uncharacterized protein n=1 Tax=Naganishia adeliensis TaxID=92952 RepID=A0ACC2V142_9TREE|nr:hypothetical protein QFC20_007268 [Naganishia adeliensis]